MKTALSSLIPETLMLLKKNPYACLARTTRTYRNIFLRKMYKDKITDYLNSRPKKKKKSC